MAAALATFAVLAGAAVQLVGMGRPMPAEIESILIAPDRLELISLDPALLASGAARATEREFRGWPVLGSVDLVSGEHRAALLTALKDGLEHHRGGIGACFSPAHGVRAERAGDVLEIEICFGCHHFHAFLNGVLVADVDAIAGSPMSVLDRMLKDSGVPLSFRRDPEEVAAERAARKRAQEEREQRWIEGMPERLRPLWDASLSSIIRGEIPTAWRVALAGEFPDGSRRIRGLLRWYGSGAGPWTGYPSYENTVERLLLEYSTRELMIAVAVPLSPREREGAARLFAAPGFLARPGARESIPEDVALRLLIHALRSPSDDKRQRARRAFKN